MPEETTTTTDAPEGAEDDQQHPEDEDRQLGEAGQKALEAFKTRARDAERAAKAAQRELDELKQKSMSDAEKAIAKAKAEGKAEALADANSRLVKASVRLAAKGKLADENDAIKFLDLDQFTVGDDGEVDSRAVAKAIDQLVKDKPYLAADKPNRPGSADGGARGRSVPVDMNALIRERMRR